MTFTFKLARRIASVRARLTLPILLVISSACGSPTTGDGFAPPDPTDVVAITVTPKLDTIRTSESLQLHVQGRDAQGDTVTPEVDWFASGGTISASGTFTSTSAGQYTLLARHKKRHDVTDTATVVVVPPPITVTAVVVTPATLTLTTGGSAPLTASARMSDGSTAAVAVTWSATGGAITSGGLYTAGSTAGTFRVIATQQGGSLADTSAVTITVPVPTLTQVILTPATVSLVAGGTQQFAVSGKLSDGSTTTPAVTYSATGGTITSGGLYTAGGTAGTFRVIATQQGGTLADTSAVTITVPAPTLTQVILTPATVSLVTGATQQFAVSGKLSDGSTTTPAVTYSATGGTITSGGLYTAGGTAGTFRVIATQQGGTLADTSAVTITAAPPTLTKVILNPSSVSLQTTGTQQFVVSGVWSDGSTTAPAVTYSSTGGTITSGGLYTAGSTAGTFRVIASQQGGTLADTSAVTITVPAPTLTQVILTPATVSLVVGGTQQFAVSGKLSDGSTTTPAVTYSATGGTITSGGLYTAGGTAGTFGVIATQQGGTLADTSAVTITLPAPTLTQVILTPATASLVVGGTQQFGVSGKLSDGSTTTPAVTYAATGGTITSGGLYTAGGTAGTFRVIATQQGGTLADTSAVTITPPVTGHTYSTNFPLTENPISEGGNWIGGFTAGLKWSDVQTTAGHAFGRQQIDWARSYSDGTGLLSGTWGPDQQATATVYSTGTAPDNYYEEVELRLRSAISANSNTGYEISWKVSSNSSAYLIIVRWNGPWGSYTYLPGGLNGASAGVRNGDVVSAKIVGNLISVYKNGALVTTSDITGSGGTVYTSGAPGMGFNLEAAGAGHNSDYGFTSFSATDTP